MALIKLNCPACGAENDVNDQKETGFCIECGAAIPIAELLAGMGIAPAHPKTEAPVPAAETAPTAEELARKYNEMLSLGDKAYDANRFQEAAEYYANAIAADDSHPEPHFRKGLSLAQSATLEDPRTDEAGADIAAAFERTSGETAKLAMVNEWNGFLNAKPIRSSADKSGVFPTLHDCTLYLSQVMIRLNQMDKVYPFILVDSVDNNLAYVNTILRFCKELHGGTMRYKGEEKDPSKYQIPSDIKSRIGSLRKKYRSEYSKLISPTMAGLQQEIELLKQKKKALPARLRNLRLAFRIPFWLVGLLLAAYGYFFMQKGKWWVVAGGGVIVVAVLVCLVIYLLSSGSRDASKLYKELKKKKTELKDLKQNKGLTES